MAASADADGLILGVDVGGTYTDCVVLDGATGAMRVAKVLTTAENQARGFIDGIDALEADCAGLRTIVHGTTLATNAVLERKGARCGMITTRGFRDAIELARRMRPHVYGLHGGFEPIIPRQLRIEVRERIDADGMVVEPLNEDEVRGAVRRLLDGGAEAVVIHFIHSYANPVHERRCADIVAALWPNPCITVGSDILPEVREFERGSTAAVNGYVQPLISGYLGELKGAIEGRGFAHELLVMQGNGGMMAASEAGRGAVHTVMSGPAAGAIAAGRAGTAAGYANLVACDMGGTSFDVSLVIDGMPAVTREKELDYEVPVRVPMIDIHTIGAGGGSIAHIDEAGILKVGPESAGADPGAIGYGRGGTAPTVTDANLVLGRINPETLTGIEGGAEVGHVGAVLAEVIGAPLGLDAALAAAAILTVANHAMAGAIRYISIEKGHDPRDFVLFAFGGAGPLHATALARELGIPTVLVPPLPGITSALGCVVADVRHDFGRTIGRPLAEVPGAEADAILADQATAGRATIERENIAVEAVEVSHEADLLYAGQSHVIRIPVDGPGFDAVAVRATFAARYKARFEVELPEMVPMLAALRTTVTGVRGRSGAALAGGAPTGRAAAGRRRAWFGGTWHDARVVARDGLAPGDTVDGPAIVEQMDTTTVIEPGDGARVDDAGNLVVTVGLPPGGEAS